MLTWSIGKKPVSSLFVQPEEETGRISVSVLRGLLPSYFFEIHGATKGSGAGVEWCVQYSTTQKLPWGDVTLQYPFMLPWQKWDLCKNIFFMYNLLRQAEEKDEGQVWFIGPIMKKRHLLSLTFPCWALSNCLYPELEICLFISAECLLGR